MQYKDNDTSVYGLMHSIYTVYEIEPGLVNERVHYTSLDGKYLITPPVTRFSAIHSTVLKFL